MKCIFDSRNSGPSDFCFRHDVNWIKCHCRMVSCWYGNAKGWNLIIVFIFFKEKINVETILHVYFQSGKHWFCDNPLLECLPIHYHTRWLICHKLKHFVLWELLELSEFHTLLALICWILPHPLLCSSLASNSKLWCQMCLHTLYGLCFFSARLIFGKYTLGSYLSSKLHWV